MILVNRVRGKLCAALGLRTSQVFTTDDRWQELQERLRQAGSIIDLGCGANPHPLATAAVDAFVNPLHRDLGAGATIDVAALQRRGVRFINSDIASLPAIGDKEFDFAYSHHVFEHHSDPRKACQEMQRIANMGAIITPSPFAEIAFGRPYHFWMVFARGNTLVFIKKLEHDDTPFGEHPVKSGSGYRATASTNPFDILLNEGNWYRGMEKLPRLAKLLRRFWYSHSPIVETVFLWKDSFNCVVIDEAGNVS